MTRYNVVVWAFGASVMSMAVARPGLRGLPPEFLALMLRMTLPVAPNLSDLMVASQVVGHWQHVVATFAA